MSASFASLLSHVRTPSLFGVVFAVTASTGSVYAHAVLFNDPVVKISLWLAVFVSAIAADMNISILRGFREVLVVVLISIIAASVGLVIEWTFFDALRLQ